MCVCQAEHSSTSIEERIISTPRYDSLSDGVSLSKYKAGGGDSLPSSAGFTLTGKLGGVGVGKAKLEFLRGVGVAKDQLGQVGSSTLALMFYNNKPVLPTLATGALFGVRDVFTYKCNIWTGL